MRIKKFKIERLLIDLSLISLCIIFAEYGFLLIANFFAGFFITWLFLSIKKFGLKRYTLDYDEYWFISWHKIIEFIKGVL